MTVLLAVPSVPQIYASTPSGIITGKWKFTYTPSVAHGSLAVVDYPLVVSGTGGDGHGVYVGGGGAGVDARILVLTGSYAVVLNQSVTFSASQAITITYDVPLQQVTIAGATTGNGTYAAGATMNWSSGEIRVGADLNYDPGPPATYYGAPALPGTIGDVTDFAASSNTATIAGTLTGFTAALTGSESIPGTVAASLDSFTAALSDGAIGANVAATLTVFTAAIAASESITATVAASLSSFTASTSAGSPGILGTNIEDLSDFSSSNWATINVFKTSRPFLSGAIGGSFYDGRSLTLDADGYPTSLLAGQRAQSIILLNAGYPTGQYVVTWAGSGTVVVNPAVPGSGIVSTAANRIVFNLPVSTSDGVYISIDSTTPGNIVRDIAVKHIDYEFSTEIWHPTFIAEFSYYSTLRFMDLQRTNNSELSSWSDRTTLTSAHWSSEKGAPVEALVDLANKTGCDPWFCMPHQATDTFVTSFATLVKSSLNTGLKPYVECSNEVWNFQFGQAQYALNQAAANTARYGVDGAGYIHWHSTRSREMHALWSTVYTGHATGFWKVLGSQASQSYFIMKACTFESNGPTFDYVAIAPYFGYQLGLYDGGLGATVATWTEAQLLTEIETNQMAEPQGWIDSCKTEATAQGLTLIAYECGQHLVRVGTAGSTTDAALDTVLVGVQDTARMGAFYTLYLEMLRSRMGDGVLCHFLHAGGWGQYGSWGARERLNETIASSPKATALYNFALNNADDTPNAIAATLTSFTAVISASLSIPASLAASLSSFTAAITTGTAQTLGPTGGAFVGAMTRTPNSGAPDAAIPGGAFVSDGVYRR